MENGRLRLYLQLEIEEYSIETGGWRGPTPVCFCGEDGLDRTPLPEIWQYAAGGSPTDNQRDRGKIEPGDGGIAESEAG